MKQINYERNDQELNMTLSGKVDSTNAPALEDETMKILDQDIPKRLVIDFTNLAYISSAGLRVMLKLKKKVADFKIINVSPAIYEIFEVTGFTEIMDVQKAYRVISVDGCDIIGKGANGKVYRIDRDTIVKVYNDPDSLPEIHRERELARTAFISGVPTAIPYDVVRIEGGGYGSVFELLNAASFMDLLAKEHKPLDIVVEKSIELLKTIHASTVDSESIPSMKEVACGWVEDIKGQLPDDVWEKLRDLMNAIPEDNHVLHGDYHLKNVMLQNGESLIIDMDTLSHGNPIFEFAGMFYTYQGFDELNQANTLRFLGIPYETAGTIYEKSIRFYFDDADEERIQKIMKQTKIIGYTHLMSRTYIKGDPESEKGQKIMENCRQHLMQLVPEVDSLV